MKITCKVGGQVYVLCNDVGCIGECVAGASGKIDDDFCESLGKECADRYPGGIWKTEEDAEKFYAQEED